MQPGLANTQPHSMRNLLQRSYVEYLSIGAAVSKKYVNKEGKNC